MERIQQRLQGQSISFLPLPVFLGLRTLTYDSHVSCRNSRIPSSFLSSCSRIILTPARRRDQSPQLPLVQSAPTHLQASTTPRPSTPETCLYSSNTCAQHQLPSPLKPTRERAHIPPFVHITSSTTSKLACATSCITCLPPAPLLLPYPTVLPVPPGVGSPPKMENEAEDEGCGTEMMVEEEDLVEVRKAS